MVRSGGLVEVNPRCQAPRAKLQVQRSLQSTGIQGERLQAPEGRKAPGEWVPSLSMPQFLLSKPETNIEPKGM